MGWSARECGWVARFCVVSQAPGDGVRGGRGLVVGGRGCLGEAT